MSAESQRFGQRLRSERERQGISLESIAQKTKIKKAYLVSLENGDFSHWPSGDVFRRAYVRDYATAVGLAPETALAEFLQLFSLPSRQEEPAPQPLRLVGASDSRPETSETDLPFWRPPSKDGRNERRPEQAPSHDDAPLALTFDRRSKWYAGLLLRRALASALDVCGLVAVGAVVGLAIGSGVWTTGGVLALLYFPATTIWLGQSIGSWYLENRVLRRQGHAARAVPMADQEPRMQLDQTPERAARHVAPAASQKAGALIDPVFLVPGTSQHVTPDTPIH